MTLFPPSTVSKEQVRKAGRRWREQTEKRRQYFEPRPLDGPEIRVARIVLDDARQAIDIARDVLDSAGRYDEELPDAMGEAVDEAQENLERLVQLAYGPARVVDPLPPGVNPLEAMYSDEFIGKTAWGESPFFAMLKKRKP